ncbi:MAG TPA: DUF3105 domain-containing protein [Chloroflexota bacterium]|nr:DUF3105 domain-containing protein [Chloroflexota bacterium]
MHRTLRAALAACSVIAAAACGGGNDSAPLGPLPNAATGQLEVIPVTDNRHIQGPISYPRVPPAGGNHAPAWQNCGYYDSPIPTEQAVHSMEHGAVWITYHPNLPKDQVNALAQLARGQSFVLVSPFPNLEAPVIATAWGRQQKIASAKDPSVTEFVRQFRAGPQTPEPGAPCTGGTGSPK